MRCCVRSRFELDLNLDLIQALLLSVRVTKLYFFLTTILSVESHFFPQRLLLPSSAKHPALDSGLGAPYFDEDIHDLVGCRARFFVCWVPCVLVLSLEGIVCLLVSWLFLRQRNFNLSRDCQRACCLASTRNEQPACCET